MERRFQLVDVFREGSFTGNPLAVVLNGDGLTTDEMQRITRWLNLSETTFLFPPTTPEADYRVRIFTLDREMPFAGHPTLGSCHAWLRAGGRPRGGDRIVQECGAGLVPVKPVGDALAFSAPALIRGGPVAEPDLRRVIEFLRIDPAVIVDAQWADNGPGWLALLLRSADDVLAIEPHGSWPTQMDIGVVGPCAPDSAMAFELRAFFTDPAGRVLEDPVTGSLNASVAQWLLATGRATAPYVASQGTRLSRSGRVTITQDAGGRVWVGGSSSTLFEGSCEF